MAGATLPNAAFTAVGVTLSGIGDGVPAGRYESVCLAAALDPSATLTAYVNVHVYGTDPQYPFMIMYNEPVKYRVPGGSPVLLMNFILSPGSYAVVENTTPGTSVQFTLYNRWQFDA